MRASWSALHAQLSRSINTLIFHRRFQGLRQTCPAIARFADPVSLLDHLHAPGGDGIERNHLLLALVGAAQTHGSDPSVPLLLLALWPGLDAVHGRLRRCFLHDPALLTSEISARVVQNLHSLDLAAVTWIAATLIRNVERDIRRSLKAESIRAAGRELTEADLAGNRRLPSFFGIAADLDAERASMLLVDRLRRLIGADAAALVVSVAVQGERQHEAAARLGCTPEAARKRYQRAIGRLREEFDIAA